MKIYLFNIITNFIAAIVLFGAGSLEMNNLGTSVPATLCLIAGIAGLLRLRKEKSDGK